MDRDAFYSGREEACGAGEWAPPAAPAKPRAQALRPDGPAAAPREAKLAPIFKLCQRGGPGPVAAPAPAERPRVRPTPPVRQLAPIFSRDKPPAPPASSGPAPASSGPAGQLAAIFNPSGQAAAAAAAAKWPGKRGLVPPDRKARPAAAARKGPEREAVTNAVVVDRATGQAYFVHEDGRRSPRQM